VNFSKLTEELWISFFSKEWEETKEKIFEWAAPECVIIGTGAHEFYTGLDGFLRSFSDEMADRNDVEFHFKKLWCNQLQLDSNSCLVYGKFYVSGQSKDKTVLINMDSRFTFIFHKIDGKWKIVHIHQSVPNLEQGDGEYYPKTLMKQVQELQSVNEEMTELAQKDGLTGLDNFRSFCSKWEEKKNKQGWFFVLDLDHFKQVNDTYGHLAGNEVLIDMGKVFRSAVRENDLLCRMGGDEFLIFCNEMKDKTSATEFAQRLISDIRKAGNFNSHWTTVSIGAAEVTTGMSIQAALENADRSLYTVKRTRRGGFVAT